MNDFGNVGYDGPEPPAGAPHRYQFSIHALPVETLGVEHGAANVQARFAIFTQRAGVHVAHGPLPGDGLTH
ncbi:hypothetical protein [Brachybacterium sp. GPGPB12]|uniref:hypothetical protein n=1 Tax=Brachybacterium sp. GPGPB12 TaxID=3023517 RepID=UPI003134464C